MAGRRLIYVVDDEQMFVDVMSVCLERAGYHTRQFTNPVEACATFVSAHPKPDLLILDFHMEDMDGIELLRRCRALVPNQKVICVSGGVGPEAFRRSEVKPDAFLVKPFLRQDLLAVVARLLAPS